jgi:asparagine synthase (glutamine-hydrolysing)
MCGICGLYGSLDPDELARQVQLMTGTLVHRGPDADGAFVGAGIALGHRRLSVIDLSSAGAQPMTLGATTVVYNGESYNFQDLRAELQRSGRQFRGHSDTEVLLHAYQVWGIEGLSRLEGIFAFALWDADRRRLILMRDRFGIKPLFYAWHDGMLAFGSEIKAILAVIPAGSAIDQQALVEYLWYGNAFEERTIFRDVRSVPPGHRLVLEGAACRVEPWWRIEEWLDVASSRMDSQEAATAVSAALDQAVARQLVSDVPLGLLLSGGVDSSSICAAAAKAGSKDVSSFAIGFDFEGGVDELPKAKRVAQAFGLDHHELRVSGGALDEVLTQLVAAHDEPFADAANIPLFLLGKALRGTIKVVLQGDGGDEMFAGYRRYSILSNLSWLKGWSGAAAPLLQRVPSSLSMRFARIAAAVGQAQPALRMGLLLTLETLWDPPTAMLHSSARESLERTTDPFLAFRRCAERFSRVDPVQKMLLTDICLQLPSQFLPKVDRAMMAHGIEARVPFLDEKVAALTVGLPSRLKVSGGQKKIVLRQAMRQRVPAEVLDGPKVGFGVPYEAWLRGFLLWKLLQLSLWSRQYLS